MKGASLALSVKIAAAGAGFGLNLLVARLLGASGSGAFYLSFTLVTFLATLGRLGLDNLIVKSVAANQSVHAITTIRAIFFSYLKKVTSVSVVIAIAAIASIPLSKNALYDEQTSPWLLAIMAAAILPTAIFNSFAYATLGLKRAVEAIVYMNLLVPLLTSALCFGLVPRMGVLGSAAAYLIAATACALVAFLRWPFKERAVLPEKDRHAVAEFWRASPQFFGVSVSQQAILWAPTLVLAHFGSNSDVGIYSAANRTAMVVIFILVATNSVVGPRFAELYRKGDLKKLSTTARNAAALMAIAALPVIVVIEAFAGHIMSIFGQEFSSGAPVLRIMALGLFINISAGPVGHILLMCGGEAEMKKIFVICAVFTVFVAPPAIIAWGAIGAGSVTALSLAAQALISAYIVIKKYKISIF
ncbi:lipopolysaccharide biosynthesis protein [Solimonas variicoloris]|uniref:lipopolysaccharide biosynthesis protein n=1 Tax=Solimonas variicoloris TaxID=254408 RepID=UPI00146DC2AC|nr:oligosaccharide flippase family protein [Solimonas variicoloris]